MKSRRWRSLIANLVITHARTPQELQSSQDVFKVSDQVGVYGMRYEDDMKRVQNTVKNSEGLYESI